MFLITMIVFRIFHHRGYRPCYIIYRLQPTKLFSNKEPLANLYMEEWKMAKYNLIAKIDDTTVENFNKLGQRIVLVKETADSSADLAWISFSPFEINTVFWEESYGVYASTSDVVGTARVLKASYAQAAEKQSYVFENGIFQPPVTDAGLASNTYSVKNNMAELPMLTFGLAQDIIANGVEL